MKIYTNDLVKGHSDFKVKCLTFGLYTQVSDSGPLGPLVYYAPPQKVAGYYVIPSELLSVCPSVRLSVCPSVRPSVCLSVRPSVRQRLNIRVRSITLIPFEIISRNLVQM